MFCIIHSVKENQTPLNYPKIACVVLYIFRKVSLLAAVSTASSVFSQLSSNFSNKRLEYFISLLILFLSSSQPGNCLFWNSFLVSFILSNFQFQVQVLLFTALVSSSPACPELSLKTIHPTTVFSISDFEILVSAIPDNENKSFFVPFTSRRFSCTMYFNNIL